MEPGKSFPVFPRSSGCSRIVKPGLVPIWADNTSAVKSTRVFAHFACNKEEPWSHGNPSGKVFDRIGFGPLLFALRDREKDPHGGEAAVST